jgi:hypothetical protein
VQAVDVDAGAGAHVAGVDEVEVGDDLLDGGDGAVAAGGDDALGLGGDGVAGLAEVAGEGVDLGEVDADEAHGVPLWSVEQDGEQDPGEPAGAALDVPDPQRPAGQHRVRVGRVDGDDHVDRDPATAA